MKFFNDFLEKNFDRSRELALGMASMGPYFEGEAGEYIAFLKESYKHGIHSLLWNNHEKISAFAASIRYYIGLLCLYSMRLATLGGLRMLAINI